MSKTLKWQT